MAVSFKKKGCAVGGAKVIPCHSFGFKDGGAEFDSSPEYLGGKGSGLVKMSSMGIPVPPGFVIPCYVSMEYKAAVGAHQGTLFMGKIKSSLKSGYSALTNHMGGSPRLVSVRSGARVSMPGMMDTILNVGITSGNLDYWKETIGERTALDCYRRLIQMLSSVALCIPMSEFNKALEKVKKKAGVTQDHLLSASDLGDVVVAYLNILSKHEVQFPDDVESQVALACLAVFESWDSPRAIEYRKIHGFSDDWGTAVIVQAMVFGNMNDDSATGVVFSRCPSTGQAKSVGEFLPNAQGEDVVAGIRTPLKLHPDFAVWNSSVAHELEGILAKLEGHFGDMQDVEFTVESGHLYILQARSGKRSPRAAFKIAYDLLSEGRIDLKTAISRVSSNLLFEIMTDSIDPKFNVPPTTVGIPAGGGVVSGVAVFSSEEAVQSKVPCILIREETDPNDIAGINASVGILTATGGLTSHAAVVARSLNKVCVVGVSSMGLGKSYSSVSIVDPSGVSVPVPSGQKVTIDGASGRVWVGVDVPVVKGGLTPEANSLLSLNLVSCGTALRMSAEEAIKAFSSDSFKTKITSGITIYVDLAVSCSGDYVTHSAEVLTELSAAMDGPSTPHLLLSISPLLKKLPTSDMAFYAMSGALEEDLDYSGVFKALSNWPNSLASRCVLIWDDVPKNYTESLNGHGFLMSCEVRKVADLLTASGPVVVSPEVIDSVFGSESAYQAVLGMVAEKSPAVVKGIPKAKYWFESLGG